MTQNRLYDNVKITKLPPAMNYGMRKDKSYNVGSRDGALKISGQRTPYARTTKKEGGKVSPISKKEAFAKYKKRTGYHHMFDPLHPMNAEGKRTTVMPKKKQLNMSKPKKLKSGGKLGCGTAKAGYGSVRKK